MSADYKRKDHLYEQAKVDGYRSRAAYKLLELQKRFQLCSKGAKVLDLGAWPGGWMQVASELVGENGKVVGIDLACIEPLQLNNVQELQGDFSTPQTLALLKPLAPNGFDCVLSDASPKLTGIPEADQAATAHCAQVAFEVAQKLLKAKGNFVCKIFKGAETDRLVKSLKKSFTQLSRIELEATRSSSSETYVVGKGYKN